MFEVPKELVERGHQVEVVDCWQGDEDLNPVLLNVSLSQGPASHFRPFEGYLFTLKP